MPELNTGECMHCGHNAASYDGLIKHVSKNIQGHSIYTEKCQLCDCTTPKLVSNSITPAKRMPHGITRDNVEKLLGHGKSIKEIAELLHISQPSVSYHAKILKAMNKESEAQESSNEMPEEVENVMKDIYLEYIRATSMFPKFASAHEGYAVILEEVDELWDEIRNNKKPGASERMRKEAIQIGAMALKFIMQLDGGDI